MPNEPKKKGNAPILHLLKEARRKQAVNFIAAKGIASFTEIRKELGNPSKAIVSRILRSLVEEKSIAKRKTKGRRPYYTILNLKKIKRDAEENIYVLKGLKALNNKHTISNELIEGFMQSKGKTIPEDDSEMLKYFIDYLTSLGYIGDFRINLALNDKLLDLAIELNEATVKKIESSKYKQKQ